MEERSASELLRIADVSLYLTDRGNGLLLAKGDLRVLQVPLTADEAGHATMDFRDVADDSAHVVVLSVADAVVPVAKHVPTMRSAQGTYVVAAADSTKYYAFQLPP